MKFGSIKPKVSHFDINKPLYPFIASNNVEKVKYLIANGADVNHNNGGPLQHASICGYIGMMDILIKNGANIDGGSLFNAIYNGHFEIVKYLVENGADINAKDGSGNTALMKAVMLNKSKIAQYLLEMGADISIKNNYGKTALDYAKSDMFKGFL